jgi:hypothetical protein
MHLFKMKLRNILAKKTPMHKFGKQVCESGSTQLEIYSVLCGRIVLIEKSLDLGCSFVKCFSFYFPIYVEYILAC